MTGVTNIKKGYTVAYETKSGSIGFLAMDRDSGRAVFADKPSYKYIVDDPMNIISLLAEFKTMTNHNGHKSVLFETGRIVRYSWLIENIPMDKQSLRTESAKSKLTPEELIAIKEHYKQGGS